MKLPKWFKTRMDIANIIIRVSCILFLEFIGWTGDDEFKWCNVTWFGSALKRLKLIAQRRREAKGVLLLLDVDHAKDKLKIFKNTEVQSNESV